MSEGQTHKQCADELFRYLWRRTNGCMGCETKHPPHDHLPTFDIRRQRPDFLNKQYLLWPCEDHGFHRTDILLEAGRVVRDFRVTAPSGLKCVSDIAVLNTHDQPVVFLEMTDRNRHNNVPAVGQELGIPVFWFTAYRERTQQAQLISDRRWWELSDIPLAERRQMQYMEAVGEEFQRSFNQGESNGSSWSMEHLPKADGTIYNTLRHSGANLVEGQYPNAAGLIFADCSSLSCQEAIALETTDNKWNQLDNERDALLELKRSIGEEVLNAINSAVNRPEAFADFREHLTPLGDVQLRLKVRLEELTTDPNDPRLLRLVEHLQKAEETVSTRQKWLT